MVIVKASKHRSRSGPALRALSALESHAKSASAGIPPTSPAEATSPAAPAQGVIGTYLLSTGENVIRICCGSTVNCGGLVTTPLSSMLA